MVMELGIASLAGLGVYVADVARRFSKTSHGDNPWTFEAFYNTLTHVIHMEKSISLINGTVNVAYRCPSVNAAVGGVSNSYHLLGLAVDIKPGAGFTPESASRTLYVAATSGTLGPVRTVIWEPTWAHIEWHNPKDIGPPPPTRFFKKVGDKYETVKAS